jgi:hypothetical protein
MVLAMRSATTQMSWQTLIKNQESPVLEAIATSDTNAVTLTSTSRAPSQAYYWTPEWQSKEEEARSDILAGRVTVLNNRDAVEVHFNSLAERSRQGRRNEREPRS